jgi:trans-aconitate 2-methyltransferase
MSRDIWSPQQYRAYASHRARPFFELLGRVDVETPTYVVDLGCGPGERTADLAARWPAALIEGVDNSPQMIAEAQRVIRQHSRPQTGVTDGTLAGAATPGASAVSFLVDADPVGSRGAGSPARDSANIAGGQRGRDVAFDRTAGSDSASAEARDGAAPGSSAGDSGDSTGGLRFSLGDLAEWMPERPVDVIFSNAALQWVPGHERLLPQWVEALAPGGRLAFSMPGNFDGPSHRILRELCDSARWRDRLGKVNRHNIVGDPADYFELLSDLGCDVDAWETTYLQVLHGTDPVLEWMKGTALRPALDALPEEGEREEFLAELTRLLREAYPSGSHGTLFPFRRIFVVAGRPGTVPRPS